jgi:hypothetical protein
MKTKEEIETRLKELRTQYKYLYDFMQFIECDDNGKLNTYLKSYKKEIEVLEWILDFNQLPF